MKNVTEIIKQKASWKGSKESAKPATEEVKEMEYLFGALSLEYPFFLKKSDKDLLLRRNMWISLLRGYDRKQRMDALKKCLSHHTALGGPNIAQFLKLLKVEPAHQYVKRLPPPPVNEAKAELELTKMRNILRDNK